MAATPKRQRAVLSVADKYRIIQDRTAGKSLKDISAEYNVGFSSISTLMKPDVRAKIVDAVQRGECSSLTKRMRIPSYYDVDEKLLEWFKNADGQLDGISGDILLTKANEISDALGHNAPITHSWINRWKARHAVKFTTLHGEGGAVTSDMTRE